MNAPLRQSERLGRLTTALGTDTLALLRFDGYAPIARGAAVLHAQADAMLAVHNLQSLDALARSMAALLRRGRSC